LAYVNKRDLFSVLCLGGGGKTKAYHYPSTGSIIVKR